MSHVFEPTTINSASDRSHRGPAIVLVGIAAMGIFIDRTCSLSLDLWLSLCVIAAIVWFVAHSVFAFRTSDLTNERLAAERPGTVEIAARWVSVVLLLAGWFGLAGAWHHWRWNCRFENDIANSATDEPQLVRMIGKVVQTPWVVKRQENELNRWQNPERTILVVECRSVVTDVDEKLDVSGQVRVSTNGALTSVSIGDLVEINGDLVRPNLPANPGDFDQRAFLQSQGISAIARTESVDGIQVIGRDRTVLDWLRVFRGALRNRAERLISNALAADTAPVAQAMLLGTRVQIDEETRRAFRESGLLHILAISGMNVGLLWSWLWSVCRWIGLSAKTSIWIVLVALPVYALVTDANPPIVRATVVAVIVAFGQLIGRTGSAVNSLALAGISVLIWNPSDLFNPGAQLSFLAVFAILHATNWLSMVQQQAACVTADAPLNDSLFRRLGKRFLRGAIEANIVGLAIWTITSPLVAREFHLVSPIGSLLTVLLVIPVTLLFWIGYSFLLVGLVWASAVAWLGVLFDFCLRAFLETVRTAASFKLGHVYVPAPPIWWTIGFYLFTLVPLLVIYRQRLAAAISVRSGLAWLVLGLAWGIWYPPHPGLTCTFISVGHGLGVLIEFPNGRTALYDAGGMTGGSSIARSISQTVWQSGRSRLDAIVISHADGDHCNAIPELSRIVSPGGLFVHRSFLDWNQVAVASAIESSMMAGAKPRLISAGQSLAIDADVSFQVLHPPADFRSDRDNPNSVVMCLEYAGRRILLTGDLELEGLDQLLKTPPLNVDILLAPHHGSLKANPSDLARWATPEYVVVSTPDARVADRLSANYGPETQILTTATLGAIRCRIDPDGRLSVEPFKKR